MPERDPTHAAPVIGPGWGAQAAAFAALALPMVVSRLGLAAMGLVDGVMLAHHDPRQLAFHGLAEALAGRVMEVGMAFVMAGMALAAQARYGGDAERTRVGSVWRHALMLGVLAGLAGLAVGLLAQPLLQLLGQPAELARRSAPVLTILLLGMPAAVTAIACAGLLEALGRPGLVAVAVVLANGLNLLCNLWLIDGVAGGPPLGAQGVAWSTTLVRSLLACGLVAAACALPQAIAHGLRRWPGADDWQQGGEQRARGRSAAGSVAVLALLGSALPLMAGALGEGAMAAFTALFLVLAPCMVVAWGLIDAAGLRLAATFGQDRGGGRLRRTGAQLATLALGVLGLLALALALLPTAALAPAVPDAALRQAVAGALLPGLALVVAEGLSYLVANLLRSLGELRHAFWLQAIGATLALPVAWALGPGLGGGLPGLLAGQALATVVRALALLALYAQVAGLLDRAWQRGSRLRALAGGHGPLVQPAARIPVRSPLRQPGDPDPALHLPRSDTLPAVHAPTPPADARAATSGLAPARG